MHYLLDSDTLIAAKNLHYRPDFCKNFWTWIEDGNNVQKIYSIDIVYKELHKGEESDFLYSWANKMNASGNFFLPTKGCMAKWIEITQWVHSKQYKKGAIDKFLNPDAADAWLIALSLQQKDQFCIVTNETSAPTSLRTIKLPDAANAMNVPVIGLYDLLSKHGLDNFNFKI